MFEIKKLNVEIDKNKILSDIGFKCNNGDTLAILGPNGSGKTTLFKSILNHFSIKKTGDIFLNAKNISKMKTDKIADLGIFYCSQNPIGIDGLKTIELLKIINKKQNDMSFYDFFKLIQQKFKYFKLPLELLNRDINVNFSGGQKKKLEIIQATLANYKVLLLDEIDSGVDIDSLKLIANEINKNKKSIKIIISHSIDFLKLLKPNKVIVLMNGKIVKVGNASLIANIKKNGYKQFEKENPKKLVSICKKI